MLSSILEWIKNNLSTILLFIIVFLCCLLLWRYFKLAKLQTNKLNINYAPSELKDLETIEIKEISTIEDSDSDISEIKFEKLSIKEDLEKLKNQSPEPTNQNDDDFDLNLDDIESSDSELIEERYTPNPRPTTENKTYDLSDISEQTEHTEDTESTGVPQETAGVPQETPQQEEPVPPKEVPKKIKLKL